jgi:hypothetical protein
VIEPALAVRYADTTPGSLSLSLDDPAHPALAELRLTLHSLPVTLRLLGASHQVEIADGDVLRETVACSPRRADPLPREHIATDYRFSSITSASDAAALAARVDGLRLALEDDPHALLGHYPGIRHAVTAIRARETVDGIAWDTWHSYPQTGQIVTTATHLRRVL